MELFILKSKENVAKKAANLISKEIIEKPSLVLGLASGKTMILLYKKIVSISKKEKTDFSKVKTFNIDEYAGLKNKKDSFGYFMNKHIFSKLNIKKENTNFPSKDERS